MPSATQRYCAAGPIPVVDRKYNGNSTGETIDEWRTSAAKVRDDKAERVGI
jgi:hypothetical protein